MTTDEIIKTYIDICKMQRMFRSIPIKLTKEERFAIAVTMGVRTHIETRQDGSTYRITEPCGVSWTGDEFVIMTKGVA